MSFLSSARSSSQGVFKLLTSSARLSRPFSLSATTLFSPRNTYDSRMGDRGGSSPPSKTLFVGGLNWATTSEDLAESFKKYGEVVSSNVIMDRMQDRSKGFGYVEFEDEATATKAKEDAHDSSIDGRRVRIDFASPKPAMIGNGRGGGGSESSEPFAAREVAPSHTLYFGNLPHSLSESQFKDILEEQCSIQLEEVRFPLGRQEELFPSMDGELPKNKGFGYATFNSVEEASGAMSVIKQKIADDEFNFEGRIPRIGYEAPRQPRNSSEGYSNSRGSFGSGRGGSSSYGSSPSRGFGGRDGGRDGGRYGGDERRGGSSSFGRGRNDRYGGGGGGEDRFSGSRYGGSSGGRRGGSDYDF